MEKRGSLRSFGTITEEVVPFHDFFYSDAKRMNELCLLDTPTIQEMKVLMSKYPQLSNLLIQYSCFNIIELAEIFKAVASLYGQDLDYIFSGYIDLSHFKEESLQRYRSAQIKAGIFLGENSEIKYIKKYDGIILEATRNIKQPVEKRIHSQKSKLYRTNNILTIPAEVSTIPPCSIVGVNYLSLTYFSKRFMAYPHNHIHKLNTDEETAYINLEKNILSNLLFDNTTLLSKEVMECIHKLIYCICLYKMNNKIIEPLTPQEINQIFFQIFHVNLGLDENENSYERRIELKTVGSI